MSDWRVDRNNNVAGRSKLNRNERRMVLDEMKRLGRPLTRDELVALGVTTKSGAARAEYYMINELIPSNIDLLGWPSPEGMIVDGRSDREKAMNEYWRDVHDYDTEGTTAHKYLTALEEGHRQQAETDQWLADAVYQQQALQQGAIVKQITDQVRNERMARLRAGMSETQIANQDMQMMMANVNAVNDQMNQYAMGSLQAQAKLRNAQAMAFNDYLQWAAQGGQSAGAGYAAAVGDADYATRQAIAAAGGSYDDWYKTTTGQGGK